MNETKVILPPSPPHRFPKPTSRAASAVTAQPRPLVAQPPPPPHAFPSPGPSSPAPPLASSSSSSSSAFTSARDISQNSDASSSPSTSSTLGKSSVGHHGGHHRRASADRCQPTTLYSDYPLDKERRRREERERPTVSIVGPLPHQCAGHETVFRTLDGKICKPLDETEFWFYKTCLRAFPLYRPFVPEWYGCVLLTRKRLLSLIDSLGDEDENDMSSPFSSSSDEEDDGDTPPAQRRAATLSSPASPGSWSLLLSEEFRLKLELEEENASTPAATPAPRRYPYIVLEDLTAGYEFPCTLDIKMGTKDLHHQITTSTTVGLRIMGMQVYEPTLHTWRQFDKLQGRRLVKETVPHELVQFVTQTVNGKPLLRRDVLQVFINKLKDLLAVLRLDDGIQIQNSSILLVYEGGISSAPASMTSLVKADVRMIDFQHVGLSASPHPELRSPTVLSPPTSRRSSLAACSLGDDLSEHGTGGDGDEDGLVWGFSNLLALLEEAAFST